MTFEEEQEWVGIWGECTSRKKEAGMWEVLEAGTPLESSKNSQDGGQKAERCGREVTPYRESTLYLCWHLSHWKFYLTLKDWNLEMWQRYSSHFFQLGFLTLWPQFPCQLNIRLGILEARKEHECYTNLRKSCRISFSNSTILSSNLLTAQAHYCPQMNYTLCSYLTVRREIK